MPYIIGVTGGIGSGKSAATDQFTALGITVVDADQVAREVVHKGEPALAAIAEYFGDGVLLDSGELDRTALRKHIFTASGNNTEAKILLETLLHPLIRERIHAQLAAVTSPYGVLVSPLLFETGQDQLVDRTLVIDSHAEQQQQRASQRDNVSPEAIAAIMENQLTRAERNAKADEIIANHGSLEALQQAVTDYHQRLLYTLPELHT